MHHQSARTEDADNSVHYQNSPYSPLLSHPRADRRNCNKNPDLRIVFIHDLTKSTHLRNRGSTCLDLRENPGICLLHLLRIPQRHMSDTIVSTVTDIPRRSQPKPCHRPIREIVIFPLISILQQPADLLHIRRIPLNLVIHRRL